MKKIDRIVHNLCIFKHSFIYLTFAEQKYRLKTQPVFYIFSLLRNSYLIFSGFIHINVERE